jgi:tetraprenyl-beta-curcumene synthase
MLQLSWRMHRTIRPALTRELARWLGHARQIPDPELRRQALASLADKRFHLDGGLVYAAQAPGHAPLLVPLVVAYQTACDYLDNLCDRSTSLEPGDFRALHASLQDALCPGAPAQDYYRLRRERDDGGYLRALVEVCQACCAALPSFRRVQPQALALSALYSELQVHKHIAPAEREGALLRWWQLHASAHPGLQWQEFAAATGSTLEIFELFFQATRAGLAPEAVAATHRAYFPWICGLHILLDYLIDLEEDRQGGDLNFVSYYPSHDEAVRRMGHFVERARREVAGLDNPAFHRLVVDGLLGYYLSDPKVRAGERRLQEAARALLEHSRPAHRLLSRLHRSLAR